MCEFCGSGKGRIAYVIGKCNDMCRFQAVEGNEIIHEQIGYVPDGFNIGGGDYLEFTFCLDCGRIIPERDEKFPIE